MTPGASAVDFNSGPYRVGQLYGVTFTLALGAAGGGPAVAAEEFPESSNAVTLFHQGELVNGEVSNAVAFYQ